MSQSLELIWVLAKTDFKLRYHGSFLGFVWVILKPCFTFLILNFVFSHVFPTQEHYSLNLLVGIVLWGFFAEGTMIGMTSLLAKAHILSKVAIPKWTIVISSVLNTLLNFSLILVIVAMFFLVSGVYPSLWSLSVGLFYCLMVFVLILSFSLFTAPLFVRFRDLNQIWEVVLVAGFYATPIIFPFEVLPSGIQKILFLCNPMVFPLVSMRGALLSDTIVFPERHLLYIGAIILVFAASVVWFRRFSPRVSEYL